MEDLYDSLSIDSRAGAEKAAQKQFKDEWGFVSKVQQNLNASSYSISHQDPPKFYNSGREILTAVFYKGALNKENRQPFAKRDCMQLKSKAGVDYFVAKFA